MGVILGIDIGGSSTKIVGLAPDLSVIDMLRVMADDTLTSLYGAMGNFLSTHHLQLSDIRHIALTGVGSSYVEGDIYGVKTIKVEEFPSVGVGGLALAGKEHAVVVSMGTGTSFLWANKGGEIRHLIGSGVGGGTLAGLSSLTTGVHQYALIRKLCQDGDLSHIDLTMADLSREQVGDLPPEATAANFAKVADEQDAWHRQPGAPVHRHNVGARVQVLRHGHGRPHRRADDAAAGKGDVRAIQTALPCQFYYSRKRDVCYRHRRGAVQRERKLTKTIQESACHPAGTFYFQTLVLFRILCYTVRETR